MAYLLDSDIIIDTLRDKSPGRDVFELVAPRQLAISVITYGEIMYGVRKGENAQKREAELGGFLQDFAIKILPIDAVTIEAYLDIRLDLEEKGKPLADFDLLIGATAFSRGDTLVTRNLKHFRRIEGLRLFDFE